MENKRTRIKLKVIFEAIPFYDYNALYKRLQKFFDFIDVRLDVLKDESGEISFYEYEKEIVIQLLKEMGETYLVKVTSKKEFGKNSKEIYAHAMAFRDRMIPVAEKIPDTDVRNLWINLIDMLSKKQVNELSISLMGKINKFADNVNDLGLNYNEHLQLLKDIHEDFDIWVKNRLEKLKTR